MPTPLDYIRDGILQKNWTAVNLGFQMLSGEDVLNSRTTTEKLNLKETFGENAFIDPSDEELREFEFEPEEGEDGYQEPYDEVIDSQEAAEYEEWLEKQEREKVLAAQQDSDIEEFAHYYRCINCSHEFGHDKERKRCPGCKKHKLVEVEAAEEPEPEPKPEPPPKKVKRKRPVEKFKPLIRQPRTTLPPAKKKSKRVENSINSRFVMDIHSGPVKWKGNNFVDDENLEEEDRITDEERMKMIPTARREEYEEEEVQCESCPRKFMINPAFLGDHYVPRCKKCSRARQA